MILLHDLIKKLEELQTYYPNIPVDIDKFILHVSIQKEEVPVYLTFKE